MKNTPSHRDELIRMLFETMDVAKRSMWAQMQAASKALPIPRAQIELLHAIRHTQPVSFKELAKQLQLTPGAISQLADGLEQQGFIERKADPNDRRIQCLLVTKSGDKILQDVAKKRRAIFEAVANELSDEELEVWVKVQQSIIKQFQALSKQTKNK